MRSTRFDGFTRSLGGPAAMDDATAASSPGVSSAQGLRAIWSGTIGIADRRGESPSFLTHTLSLY